MLCQLCGFLLGVNGARMLAGLIILGKAVHKVGESENQGKTIVMQRMVEEGIALVMNTFSRAIMEEALVRGRINEANPHTTKEKNKKDAGTDPVWVILWQQIQKFY